MRYDCPVPEFPDDYVEISERWSRGEVKAFFSANGDEYLDLVKRKVVALRLTTTDGAITEPEQLTLEAIDTVDVHVWKWFSVAINRGVDTLYTLGEEIALRWLRGSATPTTALTNGSPKPK